MKFVHGTGIRRETNLFAHASKAHSQVFSLTNMVPSYENQFILWTIHYL